VEAKVEAVEEGSRDPAPVSLALHLVAAARRVAAPAGAGVAAADEHEVRREGERHRLPADADDSLLERLAQGVEHRRGELGELVEEQRTPVRPRCMMFLDMAPRQEHTQRAAIYCRISRDRYETTLGVQRQERLCRDLCERHGWSVIQVFTDNDVSATNARRKRPEYERMLVALQAGAFDVLVALDQDRLLRRPLELEHLLELTEEHDVRVIFSSGGFDTATGEGVMHARIRAAVDAEEVAKLKTRVRRKAAELARAGKRAGGSPRPFGYNEDWTIREDEATLVKEAAERVLVGETLGSIVKDWNSRGYRTSSGGAWYESAVKRRLVAPQVAGLREWEGEFYEAEWDAILDRETWDRLRRILLDPSRRKNKEGNARKYLLTSGLARCGVCGANLVARPKADGRRCYVCATDQKGCGKIRQLAEPLEDLVRDAVFEAIDSPEVRRSLMLGDRDADTEERALRKELLTVEQDQAALGERFGEGRISLKAFEAADSRLQKRRDDLERRLTGLTRARTLVSLPSTRADAARAWEEHDLGWRRALVSAVVDHVVVAPAVKGRNFFDPSRVRLVWKA
jgi:site-specific DNA recombinase